jgi:hypothetical protein
MSCAGDSPAYFFTPAFQFVGCSLLAFSLAFSSGTASRQVM